MHKKSLKVIYLYVVYYLNSYVSIINIKSCRYNWEESTFNTFGNKKREKTFTVVYVTIKNYLLLKALVVKNSVLHDFGFGKVSPAKQL